MTKIFTCFTICFLFLSCSNDNTEISDASIKGHSFRLTSFQLSQAVDLNLDGTASTDMINEFECIGEEQITFNEIENQIIYKLSGLSGMSEGNTSTPNPSINYFECSEEGIYAPGFGNYKMINENVVEVDITLRLPLGQKSYKTQYTIDSKNNKITETSTENYPTTYNSQTHKWERSTIQIKKEFTRL